MGTVPTNFPPESALDIGQFLTGSSLGLIAGFPPTVFLTAPTSGLYQSANVIHILSTDGVGTLAGTVMYPHGVFQGIAAAPPAVGNDPQFATRTVWLNAGDAIKLTITAVGLGNTVFDLYSTMLRLF